MVQEFYDYLHPPFDAGISDQGEDLRIIYCVRENFSQIMIALLQLEINRECVFHIDSLSSLHTWLPFRHV